MKIKIVVSSKGLHVFDTQASSQTEARDVLQLFRTKFPTREGFKISVSVDLEESTHYDTANSFLRAHFPGPHYGE